jgi:hypothetical protein
MAVSRRPSLRYAHFAIAQRLARSTLAAIPADRFCEYFRSNLNRPHHERRQ